MAFEVRTLDLNEWASTLPARSQLPRLLRRLVLLYPQVQRLEFAADEDTQIGGFDGVVEASAAGPFVPADLSVWELGVDVNVKGKADKDYAKRSTDPPARLAEDAEGDAGENAIQDVTPGLDRSQTAFVFVTPRRWGGKAKWIKGRNDEKIWRDVRAYDATDLAAWLEDAPSVAVWVSTLMGRRPQGALDFEQAWSEYAQVTQPETSPALFLAGREAERQELVAFLSGAPATLSIKAESRGEALAFLLATAQSLEENERERVLARGVIATNADAWRVLAGSPRTPMVLAPDFDARSGLPAANSRGHHVVVPLGAGEPSVGHVIKLPRAPRRAVHEALEGMGVAETRVSGLARLGRRSMLALRRQIAVSPEVQSPPWADPAAVTFPVSAVLAGAWLDDNADDQRVLARLTGLEYPALLQAVTRWANTSDPPFRRVDRTWLVSAPEDAWNLTARLLTPQVLDVFEEVALNVLGHVDATVSLKPGEQILARFTETPRPYSDLLRQGLVDTLALMAARDGEDADTDHLDLQARAERVVSRLLGRDATWQHWASLWWSLPKLAEAAPVAFLNAAEQHTTGADAALRALFQDEEHTMFFTSPHVGLLWALETLAWSPTHLVVAVRVLAKLALHDTPEGRTMNRPMNSLSSILGGWRPNTAATLEQRFAALDAVRSLDADLGSRLTRVLMPDHQLFWTASSTPKWRDWVPEQYPQASAEEYERFRQGIVARLFEDTRGQPAVLGFLLGRARFLTRNEQARVVTTLEERAAADLDTAARKGLQESIRERLRDHGEHAEDPVLTSEHVERLRAVLDALAPVDVAVRHAWLFAPSPSLPDVSRLDNDAYFAAVERAQVDAVAEVFEQHGVDGILRMAHDVEQPSALGGALGQTTALSDADSEDSFLTRTLGSSEAWADNLGRGFVLGRYKRSGSEWLDAKLAGVVRTWSPEQQAALYLLMPHGRENWDAVKHLGEDTERLYWRAVGPWRIDAQDKEYAARQFLTHGRVIAALTVIAMRDAEAGFSDAVVADLLEDALRTTPVLDKDDIDAPRYQLPMLFQSLERGGEVPLERLARLEWNYLPLFPQFGSPPGILHQYLESSPEFFVDVLTRVYAQDDQDVPAASEEDVRVAQLGSRLLREWRGFPGKTTKGGLADAEFTAWVRGAWALAAQAKVTKAAEDRLAALLARAPQGEDGSWPHPAVRDVIEEFASDRLDRLLENEVYNGRGVVSRALDDGGGQERALAEKYREYADAARATQPRVAAILDSLSATYAGEARREDVRVELDQDLWD